MARTDKPRRVGGRLTTLLGFALLLAGCPSGECVSGPLCDVPDPPPTVTGTISGTVTVDGTGIASVAVRLSTGSTTTTGSSGNYSFSDVPAGSYIVTISNFPSQVTCATTTQSVTISSSARTATAHFTCQPAANASISGTVSAEGVNLPNIQVTLAGASSAAATTDASGQFSFGSLPAGSYTVTISGFSTVLYDFTTTSQSVTLSAGQAATANFDARTCLVGSIAMNQTVSGTLASGNCSLGSGEFIDWWLFSLDSSTEVEIDLTSSQFNAYLIVTDLMTISLAQDDDGGSGQNAQITVTLDAGDYLIWATTSSVGESGSYQLSVGTGGGGQTGCQEAAISMNSTVSGSLSTTDCKLGSGEYVDKWTFTLASSTSVQIGLTSSAFDAYLGLLDAAGNTVAEDDDGGGGQNSLIVATLAAGSYTIWATSFAPDETGAYQLSLQEASGSPDLVVDSVTVPASATRGDTIQVFVSVTNVGNGPAGSFRIGLYWSTDTSISTADQLSASCAISALSAGGRATCTGGMTVPTSLNAGTYYLGAIADDENSVTESDESNNTGRSSQIVIS